GGIVVICALFLWTQSSRPAILVADNGSLIGLMGTDGRTLSRPKGSGFVASVWLENDGAPIAQIDAAAKDGFDWQGRRASFYLGHWHMIAVTGKTALADLNGCGGADILISNQTVQSERPCRVVDIISLRQTGSLAFDLSADGDLITTTARQVAGQRPWAP
ncbi:MAG: competence protein ComEC, partial [Reinekea sp.]